MNYCEIYNKTADILEKGWTQEAMARDKYGTMVSSFNPNAVSFCLGGALTLVFRRYLGRGYKKLREYLEVPNSAHSTLSAWNDDPKRTQEDVIELLRNAAKRADEENKTTGERNET